MTEYKAYFSIGTKGVHAHLLELPGCFVSAENFEDALARIPAAILDYLEGEKDLEPEAPRFREIEVLYDQGNPFDPGDPSALFEAEKQAISSEEMEQFLQLAVQNRQKLLAMVYELPESILDWQASPESFTIRRILRHIGNSEEWYVSRLVDPASLPSEWENDAGMPLFEFLEMERRTAFERLRGLSESERSGVPVSPAHFTGNPDEAWTARKALRRLLEHEREHIAQVRETLDAWRRQYLARLSAERSWFMWQLRDLPASELSEKFVFEDWSAMDLLAHLGEWDRIHTARFSAIAGSEWENVVDTSSSDYYEQENIRLHQSHGGLLLDDIVEETRAARQDFVAAFQALPSESLFRVYELPDGEVLALPSYIQWRHRHDAMHGLEVEAFRESLDLEKGVGPKSILRSILETSFDQVLCLVEMAPLDQKVGGEWNIRDVLGHLADWEQYGSAAIRRFIRNEPQEEREEMSESEIEAWNSAHAAARSGQLLEQVVDDYRAARASLLSALRDMPEAQLSESFMAPWGGRLRCYDFFLVWPGHDREHAAAIRRALGLVYPERLLES